MMLVPPPVLFPAWLTSIEPYWVTSGERRSFRTYRVVTVLRNDVRRMNLLRVMHADLNHRMFWLGVESSHTADFRTPKGDVLCFADFW